MKKLLSIVLTLSLLLAAIPLSDIPVFAATSGTTGNCTWSLDGTVITISGNGKMGDYSYDIHNGSIISTAPWGNGIRKVIISDGVTGIGNYAFIGCNYLTDVSIPNSVTSIGNSSFQHCDSLTSVTIPNSVTSIGESAFGSCFGLTSINIPNGVTNIENGTFEDCCSLTSITIPDSVTSIGEVAFEACTSLTEITIPKNVKSIGKWAFSQCDSLTKIDVNKNNQNYSSLDGVLFDKYKKTLICYPIEKNDTSYTVPDGVKIIGEDAFRFCSSLTSVTIPDSVTSIDSSAFTYCSSLTSVTIGSSVTSIGHNVFMGCSSLTSVTIPASVTSIGHSVFSRCSSLTNIIVDKNNQNYSSLDGVLFSKDKKFISCYPAGKKDKSYKIPDGVKKIGESAFEYHHSLTSVIIPDSVKSIGSSAFRGCSSLASVTISNGLTSINYNAFDDCNALKTVYYRGSIDDRNKITILSYNTELKSATWYYNSCIGAANHTYDNACDSNCNVCELEREVPKHSYDEEGKCIMCGAEISAGDINGDGDVTATDLATMKLFLAGLSNLSDTGLLAGDLNGDGDVNTTDLAALKLRLAGLK